MPTAPSVSSRVTGASEERLSRRLTRVGLCVVVAALGLCVTVTSLFVGTIRQAAADNSVPSYWLVGSDGGVLSLGGAPYFGSMGGHPLNEPIAGMAATHDGDGYWEVASDGGIFAFGDSRFYGSMGGHPLNDPIVGVAAAPNDKGYWEVASDGGIFAFGGAAFYGSTGAVHLNEPVVGMAATPDGRGYWEVASDGGIFAFGDARFYGSTGSLHLNRPIVTLIDGRQGAGYSLVASDGGVFSFGSAPFFGSLGGMPVSTPIVGAAETPRDDGYWFTNAVGLVSNFGRAGYYGSAPYPLAAPVVGMAEAPGTGSFTLDPLPHTANGYDVSGAQCGGLPSGAHAFGVVQVDGASSGAMNPCLAAEVAWAGAGLNLYTFLTYTSSAVNEPGCNGDIACNAGYQAGIHAYTDAVANGVDVKVPWWLDVEVTGNWSANPGENAQLVQGAINALHQAEGVADVGIYASTGEWNSIVGGYQPDVPYWMANWTGSGPSSCASYGGLARSHALPTGPLEITQYASNTYDYDYTCS